MDFLIIVCLSSRNHYEWLREGARRPAWWQQPELRAPFVCEEALLARGSFSLMQRRRRRTGVPQGRPREGACGKADAYTHETEKESPCNGQCARPHTYV